MTIIGTGINTKKIIIINPMNKSSPRTTSLVRVKLTRDKIMNVRIKIFNVLIPPNRTLTPLVPLCPWVEDQNEQTEYYDQNNNTDAITDFFPLNF